MSWDRYSTDVLSDDGWRRKAPPPKVVEALRGTVVEEVQSGFVGAVVGVEGRMVKLEDRRGKVRVFPIGPGFLIDGEAVALRVPKARPTTGPLRSASGSFAVTDARARVARASRIFVEGRHDADLIEKVWGHDLRVEGVAVEYLEGVDHLEAVLQEFKPAPGRRVGVLVDHLVKGSKESRIAEAAARPWDGEVLIVGHPYIDIWQAVKPERLGMKAWPVIPKGIEWKHGICAALKWPHEDQADIAAAWQRILRRVDSYAHLEPALLGRVEQLIDFVTS
ncbi:DUF3097 domain-containing protein [Amnibacterium sp. CER49]|uniref:DUF3097 domain-containing protein n=1 Tax=Amnibacterium sp. CER49 TaxID=3039161 RepID=UPI00244AEBF1|nr:DUF3097 domain-containing protein [Amnibacterium sp. CER49]MDH2442684.1 DUF3097 domain-containing protein [Amnibacterium sp. CER49]